MKLPGSIIGLLLLVFGTNAVGHEIRPALLQINEVEHASYTVLWKRPMNAGRTLNLDIEFPTHCSAAPAAPDQVTSAAWISYLSLRCDGSGLVGHSIRIPGLTSTLTDALIRVRWLDGTTLNHVLKADDPEIRIKAGASTGLIDYLWLGVEHLLTGADHVLFVVGLLYLGLGGWALFRMVTSFTIAHTITLALSSLDLVRLSQRPVEAVIALSILYLAVELAKDKQTSLLYRKPWLIAFVFGLLHGFGFAGALREIGLPADSLVAALFLFNVGVEIGQLMIVAAGLLVMVLQRYVQLRLPRWAVQFPVWVIGCVSAFWLIDRTLLLLST